MDLRNQVTNLHIAPRRTRLWKRERKTNYLKRIVEIFSMYTLSYSGSDRI